MGWEVVSDVDEAYRFITQFYYLDRSESTKGICQIRNGKTVAAVLYEQYNGSNIFMHVAAEPGRKWATRDFRRWSFTYPFIQLGVRRVTAWVEDDNVAARRFVANLGFRQEAILRKASKSGGDVLLYAMFREDCRYV